MFGNRNGQEIAHKRMSFFGMAALGTTVVVTTVILSVTTIALYSLDVVDRKTGNLFELGEAIVRGLPEVIDALPPAMADMLNDERRPDYAREISVDVRFANGQHGYRPVIEVHNMGDEVVSLLSMRIVITDADGDPVAESNEWAATPIAADRDWRGPLLPGSTRIFSTHRWLTGKTASLDDLQLRYEISDVRVWNPDSANDHEADMLTRADR